MFLKLGTYFENPFIFLFFYEICFVNLILIVTSIYLIRSFESFPSMPGITSDQSSMAGFLLVVWDASAIVLPDEAKVTTTCYTSKGESLS